MTSLLHGWPGRRPVAWTAFILILLPGTRSHADMPRTFPRYERTVMTWVPPYAVDVCRARLAETFDGMGMKDAITHLGLQFWVPAEGGGIARAGRDGGPGDEAIIALRDWAHEHGIRVLLCIYNGSRGWDWPLAKQAFADHPGPFADALLAEVRRLQLDGVDVDLEGNGEHERDKAAYVAFIRRLSEQLHAEGGHLTVDTFAYRWHAPNQTWWPDILPWVDGLTTMGYEETGAHATMWRSFEAQLTAAGDHAAKLMIGLPSGKDTWQGNTVAEHLQWLRQDGRPGASFWDAQLRGATWRTRDTWTLIRDIRNGPPKGP